MKLEKKMNFANKIIQENGLWAFLKSSYKYLRFKLKAPFRHLMGKITLEVGDVKASFDSTYGSRYRIIQRRYDYDSEYDFLQDLLKELKPDDVFFDVGASLGLHTCFPAKKITTGKVVAVEPYPPNLEQLKKNIKLNKLENVQILELAMSDTEGKLNFNGQATSLNSDKGSIVVESAIGDKLISQGQIPQPNIVKIDVEGSEPLVIKGLQNALQRETCRAIYCEIHLDSPDRPSIKDFGMDLPVLRETLENYGFNLTRLSHRGSELFIKGKK